MRDFAAYSGISQATISRILDPVDPVFPSTELLIKLARATATDIRDLIVMVAPHDVLISHHKVEALAMLARLDALSDEQLGVVDRLIAGMSLEAKAKG